MPAEEKIDINLFKIVFKAMAQSDNLEIMANHLTQLLVAALEMKGCRFLINPETEELEVLASFGLSMSYVHKGPLLKDKSIGATLEGKPVVIRDITKTDRLQYPDDAKKEALGPSCLFPSNFMIKSSGPCGSIIMTFGISRKKMWIRCRAGKKHWFGHVIYPHAQSGQKDKYTIANGIAP